MEFVFQTFPVFANGAEAACAGAGGIAALQDEAWHEAVEDSVGVVAVEAVLEEVAARGWALLRKEGELEVARGGVEDYFGCGLGFEVVELRHVGFGGGGGGVD